MGGAACRPVKLKARFRVSSYDSHPAITHTHTHTHILTHTLTHILPHTHTHTHTHTANAHHSVTPHTQATCRGDLIFEGDTCQPPSEVIDCPATQDSAAGAAQHAASS